ncbi:MAG: UdgX family uracil-DNA binding protein, partial [Alphaproteobacteria bacterium]|nr:UdgX family uracil-DNA binding protein [Alphaproteobacteria bacterium]
LIQAGIRPEDTVWAIGDQTPDLFAEPMSTASVDRDENVLRPCVPRAFVNLAENALCHSHPERFALLYRLLWRLRDRPRLLDVASDPDVMQATTWRNAVRRDVHKMHAFVRFRSVDMADGGSEMFVAWFEPDHHIVERAAPFFKNRFANMRWSILTPKGSVHWDLTALRFTEPKSRADAPPEDALDEWWRVYYKAIFNPARLKPRAMTAEMPKKYWRNMPETRLIPELLASAGSRTGQMLEASPTEPPVRHRRRSGGNGVTTVTTSSVVDRPAVDLEDLRTKAEGCRACQLSRHAGRLVFGEGPPDAALCIVGEQPGDQEDQAGRPFIGPAGAILDRALAEAGIDRRSTYLTNAVKHFKFVQRGKRRIHQRPNAGEIDHCRWWLAEELRLLQPRLVVALGATAARSMFGRPVVISRSRGRVLPTAHGISVLVTAHPAHLLRLTDETVRTNAFAQMTADLKTARRHVVDATSD